MFNRKQPGLKSRVKGLFTWNQSSHFKTAGHIAVALTGLWCAATNPLSAQLVSYPGGSAVNCTASSGYTTPNVCVTPNETPLATFPVPAVGGIYTDPNFGTQIQMVSGKGSNHGYSTPSAFSATGKYVALVQQGAQVNVVNVATGAIAFASQSGSVSADTIRWDAYSDDVYYYFSGASVIKHVLSTNTTTTVVNYATDGHGFTAIDGGGTGDTTKDNWIAFEAGNEHQVCTLNLTTVQTYCADWTKAPNASAFPITFVDFVLVSPVDSVSKQRYVVMAAMPANLVYTVDLSGNKLQYAFRGPEEAADMPRPGNGNGVCDPGETCLATTHFDLMQDTDGQVYLTFIDQLESPCQEQIDTYRLSAGGFMLTATSQGGGRTGGMAVARCGGGPAEAWSDWHVGCARNAAYCVFSADDPNAVAPGNLTPSLPNTSYRGEMIVMRGNTLEFRRIGKSRSIGFKNDSYWSTPRAAISADGSMVLFDSNFGYPNQGEAVAVAYTGFTSAKPAPPVSGPAIGAIALFQSTSDTGTILSPNMISLTGPAPAAGLACTLSSSAPQIATVPAAVTIPSGATSAPFAITVLAGSASGNVIISGTCGGQSASATLAVAPAAATTTTNSTVAPGPFSPIYIHAGGGAVTDASGQVWAADNGFSGGSAWSVTNNIANTPSPAVYQSCRYGAFNYNLPVPNGNYLVTLKFAEVSANGLNQRLFNVKVNGNQLLTNFDIFAASGGMFTAVDRTFPVTVSNGAILIEFISAGVNSPMVNAIQVTGGIAGQGGTAPAIQINAGGGAFTDASGQIWSADFGYSGGDPWSVTNGIANTSTPTIYQTCRYGNFTYTVPVQNGVYLVTLKFAEVSRYGPGQRQFNVVINGLRVLSNFDIYAQAGGTFIAVDKSFPVTVTGGTIAIQFSAGSADLPMVNAIQVSQTTAGLPNLPAPIYLNAGGPATVDAAGQNWAADGYYMGGAVWSVSNNISNTASPAPYQTCRYGNFTYTLPIANGTYLVTLKFAELSRFGPGQRQFNVSINGSRVLTNFDIYAAAGGSFMAVDKRIPVIATSGAIVIQFSAGAADLPMVNAIEVEEGAAQGSLTAPGVTVNAGGAAYTDPTGRIWAADYGFSGGSAWSVTNDIANTNSPAIYQTCRYGAFSYSLPVPNGNYLVTLKFAEISRFAPGQRLFNVFLNGTQVLNDFDIYSNAGGAFVAVDQNFPVAVTNGKVDLQFSTGSADSPMVNGIQITPVQ